MLTLRQIMPPDRDHGAIAPMPKIRPLLTIRMLMALPLIAAVSLAVWNEYQYEFQHRECDSTRLSVDIDLEERERLNCLSKVGRELYDPIARKDHFCRIYGNFMGQILIEEHKSWANEADFHEGQRDRGRESARQLAEHLKECRKRRFLSFLFSSPDRLTSSTGTAILERDHP